MRSTLILYPAFLLIILTFIIYIKNRIDAKKAYESKEVKGNYFKIYKGQAPEYLEISRQTLKNQFELPIIFYFLVLIIYNLESINIFEIILCFTFSLSRYFHAYIRLTSNFVPYRAMTFSIGFIILLILLIDVIYKIS